MTIDALLFLLNEVKREINNIHQFILTKYQHVQDGEGRTGPGPRVVVTVVDCVGVLLDGNPGSVGVGIGVVDVDVVDSVVVETGFVVVVVMETGVVVVVEAGIVVVVGVVPSVVVLVSVVMATNVEADVVEG